MSSSWCILCHDLNILVLLVIICCLKCLQTQCCLVFLGARSLGCTLQTQCMWYTSFFQVWFIELLWVQCQWIHDMVYPEKKKKKIPTSLSEDPLEGARITSIVRNEAWRNGIATKLVDSWDDNRQELHRGHHCCVAESQRN